MVTPHVVVDGVFTPCLPEEGPCRDRDGARCVLRVDHRRPRKTGPCFPLTVMRCRTHGRGFTLYPPGHVPYGREAIAPVAPDGTEEHLAPSEQAPPLARWELTIFRAALDAARGHAWPRCGLTEPACWRSQGRELARILRLLGLSPEQDHRRDVSAEALRIDTLLLRDHARHLGAGAGYRRRGQAATAVLSAVDRSGCVLDSLLRAGGVAGLWGPPLSWEPSTRVLRAPAFLAFRTRPP